MLEALLNVFNVAELRRRVLYTLALLFVARLGAHIPLPGIDPAPLEAFLGAKAHQGGASMLMGLANMFTGGALVKGALFGLGIMPYISASIIMQLMVAVFPTLGRLQQEGDVGRQKINQYTRYMTVGICVVQALLLLLALINYPEKLFPGYTPLQYGPIVLASPGWFLFRSTVFLTAGTLVLMWLGDRITEKGLGNGISVLITVGILSGVPAAVSQIYYLIRSTVGSRVFVYETSHLFLMMLLLGFVVAAMVAMTQAQRKIPVQYAKRVVGRKIYGGQASFMPLKINYSGIMPVIFASALIMFPQQIFAYLAGASGSKFFQRVALGLTQGSWTYYLMFGTLIMAFSYFWVSMMFKPVQIADELKKNGGYIPGVRPGEATARFLDYIMTRLTFAGSVFLTLIALMPDALYFACSIPYSVATFFGGTGTLITVGVMLETMRQAETYFVQRRYDAFMGQRSKAPSLMGRALAPSSRVFDGIEADQLKRLWRPLIILFVFGILASLYRLL